MTKEKEPVTVTLTESDKIWNEIKDVPIQMFGLPNQIVKNHVERVKISPNELYLRLKSTSVISGLEMILTQNSQGQIYTNPKYEFTSENGYTIIKRSTIIPSNLKAESEDNL